MQKSGRKPRDRVWMGEGKDVVTNSQSPSATVTKNATEPRIELKNPTNQQAICPQITTDHRTHLVIKYPMHLERLHARTQLRARGHDDALNCPLVDLRGCRLDREHAERLARRCEGRHERGRPQAVV